MPSIDVMASVITSTVIKINAKIDIYFNSLLCVLLAFIKSSEIKLSIINPSNLSSLIQMQGFL